MTGQLPGSDESAASRCASEATISDNVERGRTVRCDLPDGHDGGHSARFPGGDRVAWIKDGSDIWIGLRSRPLNLGDAR